MRKNMFDRLLEKGLKKEREDLARSVAERLEGYELPESVCASKLTCAGNPHAIDVYTPVGAGRKAQDAGREAQINDESGNAEKSYPALVNIHGGGLVLGSNLQNKQFCVHMAKRGYIVFAIDYSLVPEVTAMTQLDEIGCAMNAIADYLAGMAGQDSAAGCAGASGEICAPNEHSAARWDGKLYGIGDSAGAWLLMETCVIAANDEIAKAWGVTRARSLFDKVAFHNGMFYATRRDKIGMLASQFFGKGYGKCDFAKYLNPELPDVINSLPPFFMMTSVNDYLRNYSVDFAKAAMQVRSDFVFNDYLEYEALGHADAATRPYMAESVKVNDDIDKFLRG